MMRPLPTTPLLAAERRGPAGRALRVLPAALALGLALAACGGDPFEEDGTADAPTEPAGPDGEGATDGDGAASEDPDGTAGPAIVIGSQAYYSNEIVAEIYAQVLEDAGREVERLFQIGQRDVYIRAVEGGEVDLLPEYTGNLLQFYEPETPARTSDDVAAALPDALPDGLAVLTYAEAQDADSYTVSAEFAERTGITSLSDLADLGEDIVIGGNAELESRPYGPDGLRDVYGVEVGFLAIGDSGGPLTRGAILDGTITMGNIYTADPSLAAGDLVSLEDPEGLFLAQNVVPLVRSELAEELGPLLDPVSAALTTQELVAMNARSVDDQETASVIAADWLSEQGLLGD